LAQHAPRFVAAGVKLAGVSPDPPEAGALLRPQLGRSFALFSDSDRRVAALCGSAGSHCVFILDRDGIVRWSGFDENWRVLTQPKALLQTAWRLR
jgi:peroxiredoxin